MKQKREEGDVKRDEVRETRIMELWGNSKTEVLSFPTESICSVQRMRQENPPFMHLSKVCCSMWNGAGGEVLPKMRFINMSRGEIPPSTAG